MSPPMALCLSNMSWLIGLKDVTLYLAERCSVTTRRAFRLAPPLPTPCSFPPGSDTTRTTSTSTSLNLTIFLTSLSKALHQEEFGQVMTIAVHMIVEWLQKDHWNLVYLANKKTCSHCLDFKSSNIDC